MIISNKKNIYKIQHHKQLLAVIIKSTYKVDDLEFFSEDKEPLQVGMHNKKKGAILDPHIHLSNTKVINEIQEVLYIVKGKVRVTYYTIDGDKIESYILKKGDILIHHKYGHGFEIIDDAVIFEVKQGPYPGTKHAKIKFKSKK